MEEGIAFTPRFDADGLIACVTTDASDGQILMLAYMNAEALRLTLETGVAHYWSRSRQTLWRKGDTSGQVQKVTEIWTDCDQDALLLTVEPSGDGGACWFFIFMTCQWKAKIPAPPSSNPRVRGEHPPA